MSMCLQVLGHLGPWACNSWGRMTEDGGALRKTARLLSNPWDKSIYVLGFMVQHEDPKNLDDKEVCH